MKKLSIISLALISAAFLSCTKEIGLNNTPMGTQVTLLVNNAAVVSDEDSKTAYTPGKGIKLEGTEKMAMYYVLDGQTTIPSTETASTLASPTSTTGTYSFTVPSGAEKATWYGIMPYSKYMVGKNSAGTSINLRLGPVQYPKANSFDPQADYMLSEALDLDVTAGAQTATINKFKRLFAPLRIRVKGLEAGEKIYSFTIQSDQEATKYNAMNGFYYVSFNKNFADVKVSSIDVLSEGNSMSAVYDGGLSAIDGEWPVWLVVGPTTLDANSHLTFTVTTETKTYTKTVTLPSPVALKVYSNSINDMSVDLASGATSKQSEAYVFLNSKTNGWTLSGHKFYTENTSVHPAGTLCFANAAGYFTFPTIPGKNIVGARVYTHPANRYNSGKVVTLVVDGTDTYNFNLCKTTNEGAGTPATGGAVEIGLPTGKTSLAGLTVTVGSDQQHLISAITLYTQNGELDPNDYYAMFLAGEDIEINGEVYNKTKYPVAPRLKKAYEMTSLAELQADATANGILFLDYDATDGKEDAYTSESNYYPTGTNVIIGRYKNHQPVITVKSCAPYGTKFVLKNVGLTTTSTAFVTSKCTSNLSVSIEDCTLNSGFYYVFNEANTAACFEEVKVNNSVLTATRGLIGYSITSGSTVNTGVVSMTNSVFYGKSLITYPTVAFRTSSTAYIITPNLDVNFDHCTLYNVNNYNYGIYALQNAKKINYNYNVSEAALTKASPVVMLPAALDPKISGSTVNYNYGNNSANNDFAWTHGYSTVLNSGVTQTGNTWAKGASPFSSVDATTGYFPVNISVVTNGAGASYDTKLWNTWTK